MDKIPCFYSIASRWTLLTEDISFKAESISSIEQLKEVISKESNTLAFSWIGIACEIVKIDVPKLVKTRITLAKEPFSFFKMSDITACLFVLLSLVS